MKLLLIICATFYITTCSAPATLNEEWELYKRKYNKNYFGFDDFIHRATYATNKILIDAHNRRYGTGIGLGLVTYKLGINQFSDINTLQFNQMLGGNRLTPITQTFPSLTTSTTTTTTVSPGGAGFPLPAFRNWTSDGGVSAVKDQGTNCNAAWAFAAVAALEGHHFVQYTNLTPPLSEQNILDCAGSKSICSGDQTPKTAYEYIKRNENINNDKVYPYTGYPGMCRYDPNDFGTTLGDYETITENDDNALKNVVGFYGPVVVGFNPFSFEFQHYKSGVFIPARIFFGTTNRYFMTVVGYGHDVSLNLDYWILKNSMSIDWGESGFIRVIRNAQNPIAKSAIFPNV